MAIPGGADPDAVEIRVLGCLVEKQRTTPDVYPLSLNALRLACNQSTNREPVVSYDDAAIRAALERLGRRRWARVASAGRAVKYRHLLDEALGLDAPEISLLTVLMLRGPQTLGELKGRSERLIAFRSLDDVERCLDGLVARRLAVRQERRPGQKEERYAQLLGGAEPAAAPRPPTFAPAPALPSRPPAFSAGDGPVAQTAPLRPDAAPSAPAATTRVAAAASPAFEARVARLEDEVAELRASLEALRDELGA